MSEQPVILHYLQRDNYGGGPKNILTVLDHYDGVARQHVATAGSGKLTAACPTGRTVCFHRLINLPVGLFPLAALQLVFLLRRLRPDVVITHGQWGGLIMGLALLFAPKCASIFICQWCSLYHSTDAYRAFRNFVVEWLTFKTHRQIVCVSEGNVRQFMYAGLLADRDRVAVIPNSLDRAELAADGVGSASDCASRRDEEAAKFIFLGRLEHQKRPDWLLRAWKTACDAGLQKARLLVLGDGVLRAESERLASQLGIAGSVSFLGYCPDSAKHLRAADALVLTSLFEGHANVVLEAMACGKPVIAMAADGVQESFTDGVEGHLVNLGDTEAFARRIVELASDPVQRRRMGERGLERARRFSTDEQRVAYQALLSRALNPKTETLTA